MSACYVYNPTIHDETLQWGGRYFLFPKGKVTKVEDWSTKAPNEFLRNISAMGTGQEDDPNATYVQQVDAKKMCLEMMKRQQADYYEWGFLVTDKPPSDVEQEFQKDLALEKGRMFVEEFIGERAERRQGGHGRLTPSTRELDWMKHLKLDDVILNPIKPEKGALDNETIDRLGDSIAAGITRAFAATKK